MTASAFELWRRCYISPQRCYLHYLCTFNNNSSNNTHTHTHPFNGPLSGTTQVSRYQKGKTNLDFIGARDSEWQWHQLGHMQIYTSLQTNNQAGTPPLGFYRPDALPAAKPTASKHWRQAPKHWRHVLYQSLEISLVCLRRVNSIIQWCSILATNWHFTCVYCSVVYAIPGVCLSVCHKL